MAHIICLCGSLLTTLLASSSVEVVEESEEFAKFEEALYQLTILHQCVGSIKEFVSIILFLSSHYSSHGLYTLSLKWCVIPLVSVEYSKMLNKDSNVKLLDLCCYTLSKIVLDHSKASNPSLSGKIPQTTITGTQN